MIATEEATNGATEFATGDINPEDYDNVNDWLAARMQVMINELNLPVDKAVRELTPKRLCTALYADKFPVLVLHFTYVIVYNVIFLCSLC